MKKTLISALVTAFAFTPFLGMVPTAKAASMNTAIRGQSSFTVYWYANDGKRYPFPNAATYFSWFNSFDSVQEVSDFELQSITLANENVTYRPGAKLVKIQTSSKVYAVARNGELRHVTSESVARNLYGSDWNLKVHDIPDVFFSNYRVGSPIYSASDYNVSNEYNGVTWPHQSLKNGNNNSNNNTNDGRIDFDASRTNINSGNAVTLTANYNRSIPSNGRIEIKNTRNSSLVKTCYNTSFCSVTVYPEYDAEGGSVQYVASVRNSNGSNVATEYSPVIYIDGFNDDQNDDVYLSLTNRSDNGNNETVTFAAGVTRSNYTNSNTTIRVYDASTGELITTCYERTYCSFNRTFTDSVTRTWYARATNSNGQTIESNRLTFSANGGDDYYNDGDLSLRANRTVLNQGETVTLTAVYSGSLPSNTHIELRQTSPTRSRVLKTCYSNTCVLTLTPTYGTENEPRNSPGVYSYNAYVRSGNGNYSITESSLITITVNDYDNGNSSQDNGTNYISDIRFEVGDTSIVRGALVKLTVNAFNVGNWNYSGNRIEIRDVRTGNVVKTCYDRSWCVADLRVYDNHGEGIAQYEARMYDRNGRYVMNELSPVIQFVN